VRPRLRVIGASGDPNELRGIPESLLEGFKLSAAWRRGHAKNSIAYSSFERRGSGARLELSAGGESQAFAQKGLTVGYGTIRRFFARCAIKRKTYGPPRLLCPMAIGKPPPSPRRAALRWRRHPMILDGPVNGEALLAYVEQALIPELRPRAIVIMDNLRTQRSMAPDRKSRPPALVCDTYPSSHDFNPIKTAFAELKACCAPPPPDHPALWAAIDRFLDLFTTNGNVETPSPPGIRCNVSN
jgi:hypothetical protein